MKETKLNTSSLSQSALHLIHNICWLKNEAKIRTLCVIIHMNLFPISYLNKCLSSPKQKIIFFL